MLKSHAPDGQLIQSCRGADPQRAIRPLINGAHRIVSRAAGVIGVVAIVQKFFGVELRLIQPAAVRAAPEIAGAINTKREHKIPAEALGLQRIVLKAAPDFLDGIKLVQAAGKSTHPQRARGIAANYKDPIIA